ncbi:hypothetical protein GDO81_022958 [Engystomops pustulosus]|uniref:Uncharacterized protein n=1 Tax=Engystomops pustulosus TaxID=76066 RepID=A0AAV6ZTK0_ENGPU|nr:hypothetical protein GDO81_022958 [Engystomops pustulosus]
MLMKPRPRSSHFTAPSNPALLPVKTLLSPSLPPIPPSGWAQLLHPLTKPKAPSRTRLPFHSVSRVSDLSSSSSSSFRWKWLQIVRKRRIIHIFSVGGSYLECKSQTCGLAMDKSGEVALSKQVPAPGYLTL